MQTQELTQVEPLKASPPPRRNRGPLVALVTAAVLVLIIGVATLLLTGDEQQPIVTEPPAPTTTITPPTTQAPAITTDIEAAAVAVAVAFVEARAAYDGESARALVADDVFIVFDDEWIASPEDYPFLSRYERALGMEFLDPQCTPGSPGRVTCTYTMVSDITRALEHDPTPHAFLFEIADGQITEVNHDRLPSPMAVGEDVYGGVFNPWLALNYPDEREVLSGAITAESIELWETRIPEFITSIMES